MARKRKRTYPNRDKWKSDGQQFYRLTDTGHDPDREHPSDRCVAYLDRTDNPWKFGNFSGSKWIEGWTGGTLVFQPGMKLEDMPWTIGNMVASTRLKNFLELHAPGHVQFLPIALKEATWALIDMSDFKIYEEGSKLISESGDYWIMNTLHEVDCMDWPKAKKNIWGTSIDSSRVPPEIQLFRIKGEWSEAYCRRSIRELCDEAGIRGPQFRVVEHSP